MRKKSQRYIKRYILLCRDSVSLVYLQYFYMAGGQGFIQDFLSGGERWVGQLHIREGPVGGAPGVH